MGSFESPSNSPPVKETILPLPSPERPVLSTFKFCFNKIFVIIWFEYDPYTRRCLPVVTTGAFQPLNPIKFFLPPYDSIQIFFGFLRILFRVLKALVKVTTLSETLNVFCFRLFRLFNLFCCIFLKFQFSKILVRPFAFSAQAYLFRTWRTRQSRLV